MGADYLCSNAFLLSRNGGLRAHPTRSGEDGEILERYEYDAYGKPTMWLGDYDMLNQEISPYGNPYYFTGRRVDEIDNGAWLIQYNRNRFLDYYTGCRLNEDPRDG